MLSDEQVECAVKWWEDLLKQPMFDALSEQERQSDPGQHMAMAELLATMAAEGRTATQIARFGAALRAELKESAVYSIGVDYHPDRILWNALQAAGIDDDLTALPWKTTMWFRDGGVQVLLGYGGEVIELLDGAGCATVPLDGEMLP